MQTQNTQLTLRDQIVQDVIETCAVKGLMVKSTSESDQVEYNHAPISLFPTPFPLKHYKKAQELQTHLGAMVNDLVRQPDKMHEILKYFKENDVLMQKMLKISEEFNKKELRQEIQYCILRSDYMIDMNTDSLKLVEYNTVASSFGCLCQKVGEVQNYIIEKYGDQLSFNYKDHKSHEDQLGQNYIKDLASIFYQAVEQYLSVMQKRFSIQYQEVKPKELWVLFVIDKEERNICDQKWIEIELYNNHGIKSMRLNFSQIGELAKLNSETNSLTINGHEIAFVYYRTGYQLEQYETEQDWLTREMLETTMPIKCPSIDVHLTTFKKFQQAFGNEQLLKEVMKHHDSDAEIIKHIFKGIWTLEDIEVEGSEVQAIIKQALETPHDFVIKPQKEGGGNNFYDEEVKELLLQNDKEFLKQFLIMERINPPEIKAYMLRQGKVIEGSTLSEFGVFSILVTQTKSENHDPLQNKIFGRLLRTKGKDSNEGGVNAGFAVIDQPLIVEIEDIKNEIIQPLIKEL